MTTIPNTQSITSPSPQVQFCGIGLSGGIESAAWAGWMIIGVVSICSTVSVNESANGIVVNF